MKKAMQGSALLGFILVALNLPVTHATTNCIFKLGNSTIDLTSWANKTLWGISKDGTAASYAISACGDLPIACKDSLTGTT